MEEFEYCGKVVQFWGVTGVVVGSDKYTETHVTSAGGGGYVSPYGGHVAAPTVSSSTITNHEFWIRTEDGTEKDIKLRKTDIPLRPNQKVTILYAGLKGTDKSCYAALINHNAKKYWHINKADKLNQFMGIEVPGIKSFLISIALWVAIAMMLDSGYAGFITAALFLFYRIAMKFFRMNKLAKALQAHIEKIVHGFMQNT